jgi:hypothetical protein
MKELLSKIAVKDTEIITLKTKLTFEKEKQEEAMFEVKDYNEHLEAEI